MKRVSLHRNLSLPLVTFYGLGTIIGAGIYVLVSEVARSSGALMPAAFLLAGGIAALTGACYAELCARFPRAAGAVLYVDKAFRSPVLSIGTGVLVLLTGVVSAATISRGFVGYLQLYYPVDPALAIIGLCLLMGAITSIGIRESAWVISLITLLEVGGLAMVIWFASRAEPVAAQAAGMEMTGVGPVVLGALLAFYAFIGFEDLVNLAEEVHNPRTTLPRAILLSISLACALYTAVAIIAVNYVDLESLGRSSSPLALMVGDREAAVRTIGLIGIIAITNGALTQIIMASRVLYGMAQRSMLPAAFSRLNPVTRTPVFNTWVVTALILLFALWLPIATLARITSAIMLLVFALVNLSLLRIRSQSRRYARAPFRVWLWVPITGLVANLLLLGYQLADLL